MRRTGGGTVELLGRVSASRARMSYLISYPTYAANDQEEDDERDEIQCAHCDYDVEVAPRVLVMFKVDGIPATIVRCCRKKLQECRATCTVYGYLVREYENCVCLRFRRLLYLPADGILQGELGCASTSAGRRSVVRATRLDPETN